MNRQIEILGKAQSINVAKVMWTAAELGLDVVREDWGSGYRSTREAAFLKLNPNAMVPVLRDGDFVLWESNTIIRYLASAYGDGALYPSAPAARALIDQWIDWQASDLNASWRYVFTALVRRDPRFGNAEEIRSSTERWTSMMAVLDGQLRQTGAFVAGTEFSLADIPIGLSVLRWRSAGLESEPLVHVQAYFERLCQRPAYLRHGVEVVGGFEGR